MDTAKAGLAAVAATLVALALAATLALAAGRPQFTYTEDGGKNARDLRGRIGLEADAFQLVFVRPGGGIVSKP